MRYEKLEDRTLLAGDLRVAAFTPEPSGFLVEFSETIDVGVLNLYDAQNQSLGEADVSLTGDVHGPVAGSLVAKGQQLRFVATGGPLPEDTYSVRLRSAANGLRAAADGAILDGEFTGVFPSGNGLAGGDFVFTFTAAALETLVVGLPDFARGPGQAVNVPVAVEGQAVDGGLPIELSDAAGITSLVVHISFDPNLLSVSDVTLGPDAPEGSQVTANLTVAGEATIAFFSLDPLSEGPARVLSLVAEVPATAPYGAAQSVRITRLEVNAGALPALADDALHAVAFVGDANRNQRYDAEDARLIARVGVGLDSGFAVDPPQGTAAGRQLYPAIDPQIIGDVTGQGGLSALDASDVLRRVVGLPTPGIPALPNRAPIDILLAPQTIAEAAGVGSIIGTLSAIDLDDGDAHTFTLVAGVGSADNAAVVIDGSLLKTAALLDFETQNTLQIRVRATDQDGLSLEKALVIAVTNVNEAPTDVTLTPATVPENSPLGTVVGQLTATDPDAGDTHTFELVANGGVDNASFLIEGNQLKTAAQLDFETKNTYLVHVRATDAGGLSIEQSLVITVIDSNDAPTDVTLAPSAVVEDAALGTLVGLLSADDPDVGDVHTFELVAAADDADNAMFVIEGNELRTAAPLDFETQSTLQILVRATDQDGLSLDKALVITVLDVNEAPTGVTLTPDAVGEDAAVGSVVGLLTAVDPDTGDTHAFELVAGEGDTDNGAFLIEGNELKTAVPLDFETQNEYQIRVRATDQDGLSVEQTLAIGVTDVNEAPTGVTLAPASVSENAPLGTVVGQLTAADPDAGDTHSFELVPGEGDADNGAFSIEGNELNTAVLLDFETQSEYQIRVRATDQDGLSVERMLTVQILDEETERPTDVTLTPGTVAEDAAVGTIVGLLSAEDSNAGDVHTFVLVAGGGDADNAMFVIEGNELRTAAPLDFETQSTLQILVRATDQDGLSLDKALVITVLDVNEAPTGVTLTPDAVGEDAAVGSVVGPLTAVDPDAGDTHAFELVAGEGDTDNGAFLIEGNELKTAVPLDFETQNEYQIRVRTTDQDGLSVEQTLVIGVTDVNEAPTGVTLAPASVSENAPLGTVVGQLTAADPDAGDTHSFELVPGEGDADNGAFSIEGNELNTAVLLDFETQSEYQIRVRATDQDGLSVERTLTVQILDEETERPTDVTLTPGTVAEDAAVGTIVGLLSAEDSNAGDVHTFVLVAGGGDADNAMFVIEGNELRTAAPLDFETQSALQILVRATDQDGLSLDKALVITVLDVNEAPTGVTLTPDAVGEDAAVGSVVGPLTAVDPDAGDTHAFELVAGEGDTDNGAFLIEGNELKTAVPLDFETQNEYQIRVRTTDQDGLSVEQTLVIGVTDVNEAPTGVTLAPASVSENAPLGTVVGQLTAADPDAGDTHSFELVPGEGDADNGAFSIEGNELNTAVLLDFETQSEYQIRVRATDQDGLSVERMLTVQILDEETERPTDVTLTPGTVAEDAAVGTIVGLLSAEDSNAGDVHTFVLVAGGGDADNAMFVIEGNELRTAAPLDFETQSTLQILVRATDQDGLSLDKALVITVLDVNEAPTGVTLTPDAVGEDAAVGSVVGPLTAVDPDAGDTHAFELVAGEGDTDNGAFLIEGNELKTAVPLDFETQNEYQIRVRTTDQDGLSVEQTLVIGVTNVNEAPTIQLPVLQTTGVNQPLTFSSVQGNAIVVSDPDAGSDAVRVRLLAQHGTVSADELEGSLTELTELLDGLVFTPDEDFIGEAILDVIADDLGHSGAGGPLTDTGRIMISVN
jgi:hypothetical protein